MGKVSPVPDRAFEMAPVARDGVNVNDDRRCRALVSPVKGHPSNDAVILLPVLLPMSVNQKTFLVLPRKFFLEELTELAARFVLGVHPSFLQERLHRHEEQKPHVRCLVLGKPTVILSFDYIVLHSEAVVRRRSFECRRLFDLQGFVEKSTLAPCSSMKIKGLWSFDGSDSAEMIDIGLQYELGSFKREGGCA